MADETSTNGTVTLYGDNAGTLYLYREGDEVVYVGLERVAVHGAATGDAVALLNGDTEAWTIERHPAAELIDTEAGSYWPNPEVAVSHLRGCDIVGIWLAGHDGIGRPVGDDDIAYLAVEPHPSRAASRYLGVPDEATAEWLG